MQRGEQRLDLGIDPGIGAPRRRCGAARDLDVPARWWASPDPALLEAEIGAMRALATNEASHGA